MRISQIEITVTSDSETKEYDGDPLTSPTLSVSGEDMVEGDTLVGMAIGRITDIGSAFNKIGDIFIYDKDGNDVTKNYKITKEEGILTVIAPK